METYRPQKQILLAGNKPWQPVQVATDDQTAACTPLNISLAHRWMKLLETGQVKSIVDLADMLGRDISKLRKTLKLADLEPAGGFEGDGESIVYKIQVDSFLSKILQRNRFFCKSLANVVVFTK